ncbi:MAG: hypothetical protein NDI81_01145 [Desulfobacula sp.]|nr:hypothetical protein [Desulfobacula sp.]
MKKILYFLIGFCIISFPLKYAYAVCSHADYQTAIETDPSIPSYILNSVKTYQFGFKTSLEAQTAAGIWRTANYPGDSLINRTVLFPCNLPPSSAGYCAVVNYSTRSMIFVWDPSYIDPIIDTDGDGIPDDCDIYPNDPTPYKVRAVSYQTSDNTFNGPRIYQWMHTDRGQTYELGTKDPEKSDFLTYSSPWEDPPTTCTGIDTTPENSEPIPENNPFTTDAPTGEPSETDTDPAFQPGEVSDGTETGDPLLRDIKSNTGKIATNTDRLGDYMKELTKAVQGMDRNTAIIASGGTGTSSGTGDGNQEIIDAIQDQDQANDTEAQGYKSNAEGLTDSFNYDGTLIEGTDYQPTPQDDLAAESWLTGFMNDNPIQDWIDASGFDTSGSVCSLSFVHPRYGNLSFSLCNFENDFALAGNILFGLCSLYGLMTIIRG